MEGSTTTAKRALGVDEASVRFVLDGLGIRDLKTLNELIEAAKDWFADWIMLDDGDSPYLEAERRLGKAVQSAMIKEER